MPGRKRQSEQRRAEELAGLPGSPLSGPPGEDGDMGLDEFNNPEMTHLSEPPPIGSHPSNSSIFGSEAETFGRPTSPKLYAQQAQFPTAVQHRVWRWDNGVPVAIGAIDAEATEEDFINQFFDAMPRPGDNRFQFRLRPIDIRGHELGKEFSIVISEHHEMLKKIRDRKKRDLEEERMGPGGLGGRGDVIVNSTGDGGQAAAMSYAEEMGRMFEQTVESAERRAELLQSTLESERERLRQEERERVQERLSLAERSTNTVQTMTEKMMESDRQRAAELLQAERLRAEEVARSQKMQNELLLTTVTSVFSQQQEAARQEAARRAEMDAKKAEQDRIFYDRQRQEAEDRRKYELEQMRLEVQKREEREKREAEAEKERLRDERERWRLELEEKRRNDQMEWERRQAAEREDRERRERAERERWEKEKMDWERRESLRREELAREIAIRQEALAREEARRKDELALQQKALETSAQRDREHAERMLEMARLEREAQREAAANREKMEREAREIADRERQRQYELQLKEMQIAKERDREHAERMIQLQKSQQMPGLGGLTDMLGMETPELLERIFGGAAGSGAPGEAGGGWAEAIPKMLGSFADVAGKVLNARQAEARVVGRRQIPAGSPALPGQVLQFPNQASPVPVAPMPSFQQGPPPTAPAESTGPTSPVPSNAKGADEQAPAQPQVDTVGVAKAAGLSLLVQRKARKAVRALVESLERAPQEQWEGLVMGAIAQEPSAYEYVQAVGFKAALLEAKASPELTKKVLDLVRALEKEAKEATAKPEGEGEVKPAEEAAASAPPAGGTDAA